MMDGTRVAKRYAKALFEAAEASGEADAVAEDARYLESLMAVPEIRSFCLRPSVSRDAARKFAETALLPNARSKAFRNLVEVVLENGRLAVLPLLGGAFGEVADASAGITRVEAVFASEPDKELLKALEEKARKLAEGDIRLETKVDGRLIKGFRLLWNNRLVDRSVAGSVRGMRLALKRWV
jgi:F-type H+-transporting ATPase subunit delta